MKLDCKIIEDLLPLYVDDACSKESRAVIDEHLMACTQCSEIHKAMCKPVELIDRDSHEDDNTDKLQDARAKQVIKKIKQRWLVSILVIIGILPTLFLGINQYRGEGISFKNLYDYYCASQMIKAIQKGEWERAYTYLDIEAYYQDTQFSKEDYTFIRREDFQIITYSSGESYYTNGELTISVGDADEVFDEVAQEEELQRILAWTEQYKDMSYEDYYNMKKEIFVTNLQKAADAGISIQQYRFDNSYEIKSEGIGTTHFNYRLNVTNTDNTKWVEGITLRGKGNGKFMLIGGYREGYQKAVNMYLNDYLSIYILQE